MARARAEQLGMVIDLLNTIHVGELAAIDTKLRKAREDLAAAGEGEISSTLEEAGTSLARGDVANFRRLVAQAVARLGHLR